MNRTSNIDRVQSDDGSADPCCGRIRWAPGKSAWISSMYLGAIVGGYFTCSWDAVLLFLTTSAITLCAGHSVGMHRRLIHNSFQCPLWLEYSLVHLGVLVGLAGPFSIIRMHDLRDWSQRQPRCHDYFASRRGFWRDAFWILHCEIELERPPRIQYEERIRRDRVYHWLEKNRLLQQLPWAILFYVLGGWSWVVWGICVRVSVCVTGHWWIGRLAHRSGPRDWHIEGAGVQGYNVPFCGLITMGECWHNNHHAFPDSARIGLQPHQLDPGWWLVKLFAQLRLAWAIETPDNLPVRPDLKSLSKVQQVL